MNPLAIFKIIRALSVLVANAGADVQQRWSGQNGHANALQGVNDFVQLAEEEAAALFGVTLPAAPAPASSAPSSAPSSSGDGIDYDKLAAAIVKAQKS